MIGVILTAVIRLAVPIVLMGLGNLFCERSGVMNLGAEGMMTSGAFVSVLCTYYTGSPWIGVLGGIVGGMLIAAIHSLVCVEFGGQQNISGLGLNTLAAGISAFLCRQLFGSGITPSVASLQRSDLFAGIPVVGNYLAQFSPLLYVCILMIVIASLLMKRTALGVRIIAVGDDPIAAETAGINVWNIRHLCVSVFCGLCGGLAGSYLALGQLSFFQDDITASKGMLAVIAVRMGRWNVPSMVLMALLFGFFDALQVQLQLHYSHVSPELVQIIPYAVAVLVLAIGNDGSASPKAMPKPYLKNKYRF